MPTPGNTPVKDCGARVATSPTVYYSEYRNFLSYTVCVFESLLVGTCLVPIASLLLPVESGICAGQDLDV